DHKLSAFYHRQTFPTPSSRPRGEAQKMSPSGGTTRDDVTAPPGTWARPRGAPILQSTEWAPMAVNSLIFRPFLPQGWSVVPLDVVHYPHPVLRYESKPIQRVDKQLHAWVAEMFDLMYEHEGVGLAANQVNLPYRLFVMNPTGDSQKPEEEMVVINPVLSRGKGQQVREEGCLSLPGIHAEVTRNKQIHVEA